MDYVILGKTGLQASVMGLGCGGHSRIGQSRGAAIGESVDLVRRALDLGVNFIDTAESYGTEEIVGRAIAEIPRESVIISTKKSTGDDTTGADLRSGLEASLRRLGTDYVDVYHLHGVPPSRYQHCAGVLVPEMLRLRDEGKIRFLGITEAFESDSGHVMLQRALRDDCWAVMMVGFNLLNASARRLVFPETTRKGIGVLVMFAVRRALSNPAHLKHTVNLLIERGEVDPEAVDSDDPLGFLVGDEGAASVPDAAYRFCRHEPGVHVVLSGTGNPEHLSANAKSIDAPPLPGGGSAAVA